MDDNQITMMNQSQLYIGTENGVVVCVNSCSPYNLSGYCFHSYSQDPIPFGTLEQLLFLSEDLFNKLVFPFPSTNERYFKILEHKAPAPVQTLRQIKPKKRAKIMKDEELLMQHGDLGSFIIRVQHRQNSSWQGRLTWVEKDQTVNFRSVWEMVKLIDSAISATCKSESDTADPSWDLEDPEKD